MQSFSKSSKKTRIHPRPSLWSKVVALHWPALENSPERNYFFGDRIAIELVKQGEKTTNQCSMKPGRSIQNHTEHGHEFLGIIFLEIPALPDLKSLKTQWRASHVCQMALHVSSENIGNKSEQVRFSKKKLERLESHGKPLEPLSSARPLAGVRQNGLHLPPAAPKAPANETALPKLVRLRSNHLQMSSGCGEKSGIQVKPNAKSGGCPRVSADITNSKPLDVAAKWNSPKTSRCADHMVVGH